eukprot:TRINITY_DN1764_c0_g1_i1.p1 TRINITY_DN1764_c0_g1~~TRINITY_DN1764_c0_g1_i1.p1  ORF type:complete len:220 (-),score=49.97 TRINITY_DN1764_c0_g1_i1:141-800(-)
MVGAAFVIITKIIRWETYKNANEDTHHQANEADLALNILIGLMVPACGYLGAKQKNRGLLSCFYGWSLFCGICGAFSVILTIAYLFTGIPTRDENGNESTASIDTTVALVNIVLGALQAVIYGIQYNWGMELAKQEFFATYTDPALDLEMQPVQSAVPRAYREPSTGVVVTVHQPVPAPVMVAQHTVNKPPEYDELDEVSQKGEVAPPQENEPRRSNMQ